MSLRKKKSTSIGLAIVNVPFDTIIEPVPQRTPLEEATRDWERRNLNWKLPYRDQNVAQRVMGESTKYRLDHKYMTDAGINKTTSELNFRT